MRANLYLTEGLIMAEPVMLALGEYIGRQEAHDVVYDAAQLAATGDGEFGDLLSRDDRVSAHLTTQQIEKLIDPASYTGLCRRLAEAQSSRARELSNKLKNAT